MSFHVLGAKWSAINWINLFMTLQSTMISLLYLGKRRERLSNLSEVHRSTCSIQIQII